MKLFLFDPHVHERPMLQKKIAANLQAFRTQVLKRERNKKKEKEKEKGKRKASDDVKGEKAKKKERNSDWF